MERKWMDIHQAARNGDIDTVQRLLRNRNYTINELSHHEATPLVSAINMGQMEMIRFLVKKGANVNASYGSKKEPPLNHAVGNSNSLDVTKLLISLGADARLANADGWTALHTAAFFGAPNQLLALLVDNNADVHATTNNGETAADIAKRQENFASFLTIQQFERRYLPQSSKSR